MYHDLILSISACFLELTVGWCRLLLERLEKLRRVRILWISISPMKSS